MRLSMHLRPLLITGVVIALAFMTPMALAAPGGQGKGNGPPEVKKQGPFSALSGKVTNSLSGAGLAGVTVAIGPHSAVTGAGGMYEEKKLPAGCYNVSVNAVTVDSINYSAAAPGQVCANKGVPAVLNIALDPNPKVRVIVDLSLAGDAVPGAVLTATANIKIQDGSTLMGTHWSSEGLAVLTPDTTTAEVALGSAGEFKHELIMLLQEPAIGPDQLPPNVPPPDGEFVGGLQDRFQVVGINHLALEEAAHVGVDVCVDTSSGHYCDAAAVSVALPYAPNPGIRNVPIGVRVLLQSKTQASYNWSMVGPGSSTAELIDPTSQNPEFTPDVVGVYTLAEAVSGTTLTVRAGTWRGVIVGQDLDGRPVADGICMDCHDDGFAPDKFTPWAQTGHAEIFTNNLNTSRYYNPGCFGCHTVGFNPKANNGGADDAFDYETFLASGLLGRPGNNWSVMVGAPGTIGTGAYPETAQLANIQCENCHGPQSPYNGSHGGPFLGGDAASRISLSSEVCAQCHGEPLRHARFQQWQLSRHSNYELAEAQGTRGDCARCHTSNGFLAWLPVLLGEVPGDPQAAVAVTWGTDDVHPQTCVTCHDPHEIGTTSGNNTNAVIRISDDTPMLAAGFQALGVGKGAMCMTCHNTRRGLRNDSTWAATTDRDRAPHGGVQGDLLMGQNAYFVTVGNRGKHSLIEDSCVNCHMGQTPPPDLLSYNQGGTNHTFFASIDICSNCHGAGFTAAGVQAGARSLMHNLEGKIVAAYRALINEQLGLGRTVNLNNGQALITAPAQLLGLTLTDYHGRQALVYELVGGVVGPVGLSAARVTGGGAPPNTTLLSLMNATKPDVLRAGWNYLVVHSDASEGVHNPDFSFKILQAAINAL